MMRPFSALRLLAATAVACAAAMLLAAAPAMAQTTGARSAPALPTPPTAGQPAPAFTAVDTRGQAHSLADYRLAHTPRSMSACDRPCHAVPAHSSHD